MPFTDTAALRAKLDLVMEASDAYYNSVPIMDDATYDAHYDAFVKMVAAADPKHPTTVEAQGFLATVGASVAKSKWAKVPHKAPMTSLNKAQTEAELMAWYLSAVAGKMLRLVLSDKCDGISISLIYTNDRLVQALTRGEDGTVGEDITRNVVKMKGIVHVIKGFTGCIRGEIVLLKSDWKKYFPEMGNPRNAAAGIAKRDDGEGCEHLTVLHYQMIRDNGAPVPSKSAEFQILTRLGCAVPSWFLVTTIDDVKAVYADYIASKREKLDYLIDGLVAELDDLTEMDNLGMLNKRPKGAVAYKFPHEKKPSILRNIRDQVGKSGRVTPVAEFDSVHLAGANVVQASLHNYGNIARLCKAAGVANLAVGDEVMVSRRNDVIPYVEALITPNGGAALVAPSCCPECSHPLVMNGEYLVCYGEDCPAQVLGAISRWVKKIGVLGLGDSIIEALIEHAGVTDAADLYVLDANKCEGIVTGSGSRLGRTAHIVLAELRSKSEVPLHVFVGSLGIPLCARSVCKVIVDAGFDSLDKMEAATETQVASIPGLGTTKAAEFVKGFRARRTLMDKLLDNGVTIKAKSVGSLSGQSACMTGFRSPEMEKAIEDAGGTVKSSVGKGLTYLVQKDPSSMSEKSKKALALGVKVIGVDDMWAILGRAPGGGAGTLPVIPTAPRKQLAAQRVAPVVAPASTGSALDLFGSDD